MTALWGQIARDPNLLSATVFGGCLLIVAIITLVWFVLFQEDERRLRRRLERLNAAPRAPRPDQESQPTESLRRDRQDSSIASLDRLIKRVLPNVNQLRLRLVRSGWSLKIGDYLLLCLAVSAVSGVALAFFVGVSLLVSGLSAIVLGVGLPHMVLSRRIVRRTKKFVGLLPEALDLIVRGIRSGLPASEAMRTIAEEIQEPVGGEFREVTDQMRIGVAMDEALWSAAKRLAIPEFNFLVISLSIQQETGGNLAEILEKLSDMVRRREQMRLKVKAMSSEARASAMIIGSLPFVMAGVISVREPRVHEHAVHRPARLGDDRHRPDQPARRARHHGQNDQVRDMNRMDQVLPFGLTGDGLLVALAGAMAFLSVLAVWYALLEKHPMERRARMLATRRDELRGQVLRDRSVRKRQKEGLSMMRQVVDVLKLLQNQQTDKLHDRLSQAGMRSRDAVIVFLFFKVATPVLLAAVAFLLVYLLEFGDLSPGVRLLVVLGGAVLGFFVPELCVSNRTKKRQLALSRALPDGLDLLVICAESGLSLDAALGSGRQRDRRRQLRARRGAVADLDRAGIPARAPSRAAQSQPPHQPALDPGRGEHAHADREVRHAAVAVAARAGQRIPRSAAAEGGGEGGAPARDADRADDRVHSAGAVHRPDRPGGAQGDGHSALSRRGVGETHE